MEQLIHEIPVICKKKQSLAVIKKEAVVFREGKIGMKLLIGAVDTPREAFLARLREAMATASSRGGR